MEDHLGAAIFEQVLDYLRSRRVEIGVKVAGPSFLNGRSRSDGRVFPREIIFQVYCSVLL